MKHVPTNRFVCFFTLAAAGLTCDLYSKSAVFSDLGYPERTSAWTESYFGGWMTFRFFTNFNEGALWGIGQDYTWIFASLSVVAVAGVLYWLFLCGAARSLWLTCSLALIMAGTLGNLYDRLGLHGCIRQDGSARFAVRDFLLFTFGDFAWPVFNFADVFLVTGACMLVFQSFTVEAADARQPTKQSVSAGLRSGSIPHECG